MRPMGVGIEIGPGWCFLSLGEITWVLSYPDPSQSFPALVLFFEVVLILGAIMLHHGR